MVFTKIRVGAMGEKFFYDSGVSPARRGAQRRSLLAVTAFRVWRGAGQQEKPDDLGLTLNGCMV